MASTPTGPEASSPATPAAGRPITTPPTSGQPGAKSSPTQGSTPSSCGASSTTTNASAARPVQVLTEFGRAAVVEQILAPDGPLAQRKVFTRPDIIRAAAPMLYGCVHEELDQVVSAVISHHEAVRLVGQPAARGRAWAVASALATEEAVGTVAAALAARSAPALDLTAVSSFMDTHDRAQGFELTTGQRRAVAAVCTSGRGLDLLIGVAGSGKTTALSVVHEAYRRAGYRVIGTAISGQAARTLGTETGIDSRTTASLTARIDQGTTVLDRRTLVVIDEAGMTDDRSLLRLLETVERAGAKAVVVGDHRQLGAVGAGGGLEALLDRNPDAVHVLDENVRQHHPAERQALDQLRIGDIEQAVDWSRTNDRIQPQPTSGEAVAASVAAWHDDLAGGKESVLLAWRRNDVAALNRVARRAMVADGTITGPSISAPGGRTYAAGDRVVMLAPGKGRSHVTSERATVTRADDTGLSVRFDDGRSHTLNGAAIDLDHLDHAYALTVHRMQGATVDRAHLLADGGGRELTYVAMSRAKESTHVHVVADDLDQAVDDLTREWSTECRQRWVLDTDAPAAEHEPQRPALAKRPTPENRACQIKPETVALEHAAEGDQQAKVDQIARRLDALEHRRPTPGRGLGIG